MMLFNIIHDLQVIYIRMFQGWFSVDKDLINKATL